MVSGILTDCDVWYGVSKEDLIILEILEILNSPRSTPKESLYIELGIVDIETIIKSRRIHYLHYLCIRQESEMISKIFTAQWKNPNNKQT